MVELGAASGIPARQFSAAILGGSWPHTDPMTCDTLAQAHHVKAQELLHIARDTRGVADQVVANQSGATVQALHTTSYELASTFTGHADRYFAMKRASAECGRILSGLRTDLDSIDARAHEQINRIMRSATTGPLAVAARIQAIQVIAEARADAIAKSADAAARITAEGTKIGIEPTDKAGKHGTTAQAVDYTRFKESPTDPPPPPDPPEPRVRGLPPEGVRPPVDGPLTPGPPSRPSEAGKGGKSLWDKDGGEWRYFPGDKWHNPHWDYNGHQNPNSPWGNVPIGGLPPRIGEAPPAVSGLPPWLQNPAGAPAPAPAPTPGWTPPAISMPSAGDLQTAGGEATVAAGGGLLLLILGAMLLA